MKRRKRLATLLMAAAMTITTLPMSALADDGDPTAYTSGLCEHHIEHTEDCGYTPDIPGTECIHKHDDTCGYSEGTPKIPCSLDCAEVVEATGEIIHNAGCDYTPAVEGTPCQHEHDEACGYAPAVEGTPCTFVCEICNSQDGGEPADKPQPGEDECSCEVPCTEDQVNADCLVCGVEGADLAACKGQPAQEESKQITITAFDELPEEVRVQSVPAGTALEALNLSAALGARGYAEIQDSGEDEALTIEGVTWTSQPDYDPAAPSEYSFTPALPEGYALAAGLELPVIVVTVLAADNALVPLADAEEQFDTITPGETYWFDLSEAGIPGSVNGSLPDSSLHWVPFTYTGTINAYVLNENSSGQAGASQSASTTTMGPGAYGFTYDHSLFIADYAVTHTVNWDDLNAKKMIFGMDCQSGGVSYSLRAPSAGSNSPADSNGGIPKNNEWDAILNKNSGYIKNWREKNSYGQDTYQGEASYRTGRGHFSVEDWLRIQQGFVYEGIGLRPVLEVLNADTLDSDGLSAVAVNLNDGKIGAVEGTVNIVVKSGESFTAPSSEYFTVPAGKVFAGWLGNNSTLYEAEASVPSTVTTLTAQWNYPAESTPAIIIDYKNETLTGFEDGSSYTINGQPVSPGADGTLALDGSWFGKSLSIVKKGDGSATSDSVPQPLPIPARPKAPAGLQGENETYSGDRDGKITGVSSDMEYQKDGAESWENCTGEEITGLVPGTYLVRLKATEDSFASEAAQVEIKTGAERTYTLNVTAPAFDAVYTGYAQPEAKAIIITSTGNSAAAISDVAVDNVNFLIEGSGDTVPAGESITTWTVRPASGLGVGSYKGNIIVTYNGGAAAAAEISFTVKERSSSSGSSGGGSSSSSYRDREYDFWMSVKDKINEAEPGDTIKVNAKGYDRMPWSVMEALRNADGVTLHITWNGGEDIIIPFEAALNESSRVYYPLSYLEGIEFTVEDEAVVYDPGKVNPQTGGIWEVTAPAAANAITTPAGEPEITNPQRGLAETPELAEKGIEKEIPGVYEPETIPVEAPAQETSSSAAWIAVIVAVLTAGAGGAFWFWRKHKAE